MGNFGEILLIGGKSSWERNMHIYPLFTDLFNEVHFYLKLGKKLHIPQLRMSDHNEKELRKELFEDQSYSI